MSRYHTSGQVCDTTAPYPCTSWHTTTTPVASEGKFWWPIGTEWDTPAGPVVSPQKRRAEAWRYTPPRRMQSADEVMRGIDVYHGAEHDYSAICDAHPKCVEVEPKEETPVVSAPPGPEDNQSPRASALNEARDLITGDRNAQYGPPTQDFARTADLLNALGYRRVDAADTVLDILASDVAIIIAQVKVSRLMHSRGKRDSWVDLAGYAGCGYECAVEEAENV